MVFIERTASRVLLLSPKQRVLILRLEPELEAPFWVTPGGGIDEGETIQDAALRELYEEVGRDDLDLGPCIWRRTAEFSWGDRRVVQDEHVFLVTVAREFEPVFVHLDAEPITGSAWMSEGDIRSLTEVVYPEQLADLVSDLVRSGPPSSPVRLPPSITA